MRGAINLLPQYAFMAWELVKHRENFACLSLPVMKLIVSKCAVVTAIRLQNLHHEAIWW